jgi:formylglycine-generating enzyme required for sulfatase activity
MDNDKNNALEKDTGEKSARTKSWARLKKPALLVGVVLLGIVVLWPIIMAVLPAIPTPGPTLIPTLTALPTKIPFIPTKSVTTPTGEIKVSEKDGMNLHYIPAGPFMMGSTAEDGLAECKKMRTNCQLQWFSGEAPPHKVTLNAFWIDETEVTNRMYALCAAAGACQPPADKSSATRKNYYDDAQYANYPVTNVVWDEAKAYCAWAGRALPSEAQWEKAARGTDGRTYPWGNDLPNKELLNYDVNVSDTTEVGLYVNGRSPYGAYDMAGNVWEWVNDWADGSYYASSPASNPLGPDSGESRGLRGGSWYGNVIGVRSTYRGWDSPVDRVSIIGFRCALSSP